MSSRVCVLWVASVATAGVSADNLQLALPLVCSPENYCSIQNHVDLKPGPGAQDFGCGVLTYDGHRGADFQVCNLALIGAGVPVAAAAPGMDRWTRGGVARPGAHRDTPLIALLMIQIIDIDARSPQIAWRVDRYARGVSA